MRLFRRLRILAAAGLVVVAALVAGGLVLWRDARASTPVSERQALGEFRLQAEGGTAAGGPAPGVYRYAASGSEQGGLGPFSVSRRLPSTAVLVVVAGEGGWNAELSYSEEHVEGAQYLPTARGILITRRRTKVEFAGFGRDDRRAVVPPSLFMPAGPHVGDAWAARYRTGDIAVVEQHRIVRAQTLTVGGRRVATLVVTMHAVTTGPHSGTRDETMWWAPSVGLPVRWDVRTRISGIVAFTSTSSVRLTSLDPAR